MSKPNRVKLILCNNATLVVHKNRIRCDEVEITKHTEQVFVIEGDNNTVTATGRRNGIAVIVNGDGNIVHAARGVAHVTGNLNRITGRRVTCTGKNNAVGPEPKLLTGEDCAATTHACVVCLSNQTQCAAIPCGHAYLCIACANLTLARGVMTCAHCRAPFQQLIRVFL